MIKLNTLEPLPDIFNQLEVINPNLKIFEIIGNGTELDSLYLALYGERYTTDTLDSEKSAKFINMLYAKKWDNAYTLIESTDMILSDLGSKDIETVTKKYKYTDTIKDVDSLPAFDDTELNVDTQNDRQLSHDEITDDNVNETVTVKDKKDMDGFNKSYEYLMKNWIYDIVFTDVNSLITLSIHN